MPPYVPEKLHEHVNDAENDQLKEEIKQYAPRQSNNFLGDFMMKRINNELKNF